MALSFGTRLGPYEITAQIGQGGMGEVYRATDTNLGRMVAIKVLPEAFAQDAERLARFEREAKTLAQLNHPNIATIHGVEKSQGTYALVMELVEGPTLADRIAQGAIPVDEALPVAKQIAEALEAAHEQGIIHRDLKPANIKVRPDGTVKVLDFGLAKAMEPAGGALPSNVSQIPTITTPAMTQAGMILGTAAYMSPEQAKGRTVDRRADVWAFGAVLYEMLTGERAFGGDDVAEVLSRVLQREPDWAALPSGLSPTLVVFLRRCLQKDLKQRIGDIHDVRLALEGAFEAGGRPLEIAAQPAPAWRRAMPWAAGAVLGGALVGILAWTTGAPVAPSVQRYSLALDAAAPMYVSGNTIDIAISPNGQYMVYPSGPDGGQLRLLSLSDGSSATLVTQGRPSMPFFSPDGTWVGFVDQPAQELRRVPVDGGPVEVIARVGVQLRGATWGVDGTVVYGSGVTGDLRRVPATGGTPEALTVPDAGAPHVYPSFLPDGRALLFAIGQVPSGQAIAVLSLDTRAWEVLGLRGSSPRYAASGHLVYETEGTLRVVPFDAPARRVMGEPVTVETGVLAKNTGAADYAVSPSGSLVFAPAVAERTQTLGWVTREGVMTAPLIEAHTAITFPRLSGDAGRVAYVSGTPGDVWVRELARGSDTRVTTDGTNAYAIWGPDGDSVTFFSNRDGQFKLYRQRVDLSGRAEVFGPADVPSVTGDWSNDGRALAFYVISPDAGRDIWTLSLEESARPLLATPFNERAPALSPDGRWVAYVSDQSGTDQVYLMPFPDGGRVIPVSTTGGIEPAWSSDGRELFYRVGTQMWAVPLDPASGAPDRATLLFDAMYDLDQNATGTANYDVSPDGQRFLMVRTAAAASMTVTLVENWLEQLKRLVRAQ